MPFQFCERATEYGTNTGILPLAQIASRASISDALIILVYTLSKIDYLRRQKTRAEIWRLCCQLNVLSHPLGHTDLGNADNVGLQCNLLVEKHQSIKKTLDYFKIYAPINKRTYMLRETFTLKFRFVQKANSRFSKSVSKSIFQVQRRTLCVINFWFWTLCVHWETSAKDASRIKCCWNFVKIKIPRTHCGEKEPYTKEWKISELLVQQWRKIN